ATGGKAPVVRAVVMIAGMVLSGLADRRGDPGSGLALAGLILLANNPLACQDAGFQLSFSATASILVIIPLIRRMEKKPLIIRWPLNSILVSGAAGLGTAPLTIYHFYSLVPVSVAANLIAIPVLSAIVVNGLLAALLVWIWPEGAVAVGWLAGWAVRGITGVAQLVGELPGGRIFLWPGAGWWTLSLYFAAALFLGFKSPAGDKSGLKNYSALEEKKHALKKINKGIRITGLLLGAILIVVYPLFRPPSPRPGETRVTFLSLGIGESALIENGQGTRILIDVGTEQEFLWRVKPYLAGRGINRLDALLLSHTDADHAGGTVAALDFFRIRKVISAGLGSSAKPRVKAIEQAIRRGKVSHLILRRGESLKIFPGMEIESIWPPRGGTAGDNKHCLAVWIKSPAGRLLFTGDSPDDIEAQWLLDNTCDLLKAGHHGARNSSSCGLLVQAQPQVAVVTPGNRNPFGLPDGETLERLKDFSEIVLNTKSQGAVEVTLQPGNIFWQTWK
ncbi:ComEC/Rec2 family competence protein, partial [bacterium]|nr:ComEC/Rec2 family competence protein [bacterium]